MLILPLAPVKRVAEHGGAERVGNDATEALALAAEEWIKKITLSAQKYAKHAGRKTLKAEDVLVVVKEQGIMIQLPPQKMKTTGVKPGTKETKKPVATPAKEPVKEPVKPAAPVVKEQPKPVAKEPAATPKPAATPTPAPKPAATPTPAPKPVATPTPAPKQAPVTDVKIPQQLSKPIISASPPHMAGQTQKKIDENEYI
jgi:histone H3/H4